MKVTDIIESKIVKLPPGYVFTYADVSLGEEGKEAVIKALNRMVSSGKLGKLAKGKFYKPESTVFGELQPDLNQVVKDLLENKGKVVGYLTGLSIYSQLGLTTQISNVIQIGRNDIRPTLKRGRYTVSFIRQKNIITRGNIPYLQILDSVRYIKKIPDTSVTNAFRRIRVIIEKLSFHEKQKIVKLALKYPPSTRAVLGTILDISADAAVAEPLRKTLNPITTYKLGIAKEWPSAREMEHQMRLHENKELFRQAVQFTSQQMGIPEIYVEKDYWVTYVLYAIFNSPIGADTVFKGGTSLLKCHRFIERFSEDVDLIALRKEGETDNKLKGKLKQISNVVASHLPEVEVADVTRKVGMTRKTAHSYAKEFHGDYGQVRDVIIVEATWLGYFEPYSIHAINSFIYEMMINTGQKKLAEEYWLLPFEAKVLEPKRTFCEKIMSLVRFSYTKDPIGDLKKKIRHTYDLHQLLQDSGISEFFYSKLFDDMLLKVAHDDIHSFRNNNAWLRHHPSQALIFLKLENVWDEMKSVYNGEFRSLVFGNQFPPDSHIFDSLHKIREKLGLIKWDIDMEAIQS